MKDLTDCPICGDSSIVRGISLTDRRKNIEGSWTVWDCNTCKAGFLNPMPEAVDLNDFYSAYYDSEADLQNLGAVSGADRNSRLRALYHWLTGDVDPRDFINPENGSNVLDYGCGGGSYFDNFEARGINMYGAELAQSAVSVCEAKGYKVRLVSDLKQIPYSDDKFHYAYAMQVLEHLVDPHQFLDELIRVTNKDSTIYLAVPNYESFWRKVFKVNWISGWFSPFHVVHYSESSIRRLVRGHGLVVKTIRSRTPESWFRLNVKAAFRPTDNRVQVRAGTTVIKLLTVVALRIVEVFVVRRDCLVVELVRERGDG